MMKCVDLFCGCGGMSLGVQQAGIHVACAMDNWETALNVYRQNFQHEVIQQDLSDVAAAVAIIRRHAPDLIVGGPPCQDFSSAGKRDVTLGRADLTYRFADIVCAIAPRWFVMENVGTITKSPILHEVVEQFKAANYGLTAVILDASYCGVPQTRNRFFLIGERNGQHGALLSTLKTNLACTPLTVKDYLGDSLGIKHYYRHPRNYNRRGIFSIDEPSPTIRGVNRPIPPNYQKSVCDPQEVDLSAIRPLTTLERSYLQTFPKDFVFKGTKTNLEQMIGNAVPVNLAKFIAACLVKYQNGSGELPAVQLGFFGGNEAGFNLPARALHRA